ncbi:402_t:CDS:2, partial [Gigaspora margarita]
EEHIARDCPTRILQPQSDNQKSTITNSQLEVPEVRVKEG